MAWSFLFLSGLFEIVWAVGLKFTEGFTRLWPSVLTVLAMIVSFYCFSQALKGIPLGTGYAVWTGIGATGTAIVGILWFREPVAVARLVCIGLIGCGIAGLKLTSPN